jgi:hypothetical protein
MMILAEELRQKDKVLSSLLLNLIVFLKAGFLQGSFHYHLRSLLLNDTIVDGAIVGILSFVWAIFAIICLILHLLEFRVTTHSIYLYKTQFILLKT